MLYARLDIKMAFRAWGRRLGRLSMASELHLQRYWSEANMYSSSSFALVGADRMLFVRLA